MQLEEIKTLFFQDEYVNQPYRTEEEFHKDLLRFLDMLFMIACSLKYLDGEDECPIEIENAHLRGIPITGKEVIASLYSNTTQTRELPWAKIKEILSEAADIIKRRQKQTSFKLKEVEITKRLSLTSFEKFLVLLAWANYKDAKYELLYCYLQGDVRMKLPSLRMAVSLYGLFGEITDAEVARLNMGNGIIFKVLLEQKDVYDSIKLSKTYTLSERFFGWLNGTNEIESLLVKEDIVSVWKYEGSRRDERKPLFHEKEYKQISNLICKLDTEPMKLVGSHGVLNLYGMRGIGKRFLVQEVCAQQKKQALVIHVTELLKKTDLLEYIDCLYREWVLSESLLCFIYPKHLKEEEKADDTTSRLRQMLQYCKNRFPFFVWVSEEKAEYLVEEGFQYISVEMKPLSLRERYQVWTELAKPYPVSREIEFQVIANQYMISIKGIEDALWNADLVRISEGRDEIAIGDIQKAIRQQSVSQFGSCATEIPATYTWEDLIIPEEQRRQLEMICNQAIYKDVVGEEWGFYNKTAYGRGVCALFYGVPGTGKTMAVQVLANALGFSLYRIDLSQLVSKYVGETEKNISKVFECARGMNVILFFDEADSLFAKRLDVKDSMDRSANAQTAHLLQEIENYDGITILATNMAVSLDDAFKRRIRFMVKFTYPSKEIRQELWQTILPKQVPCEEELDLSFFADRFELSGSSIKEILTTAAFLAASQKRKLRNEDIMEAIKLNYSKYGMILSNEEFEYLR